MPLREHEAQRFAQALDDYDDLSVADIGGSAANGFWLTVRHHFDLCYEISSHCDYWNFIAGHAVGRPLGAATLAAGVTA